jgi:hypothetical protein
MKKKTLKQVGITEDGTAVVSGVFHLFASQGIPLSMVMMMMRDNDMVPSGVHLYDDAVKNGWNDKTIFRRFEEAYSDSYGYEFWKGVKERLMIYSQKAPK